ncbi:ABC transporter permease [Terrirubrum flagellatum]|uniref:ABC transporter permease n=1 Tax=Terrirubrum flagellatum TaxID=2895980 RepID=UPI003CC833D4
MMAQESSEGSTFYAWLTADVTTSPSQARLQRAYFGWRRLCSNRLTVFGMIVLLLLVIIAALAPVIAPEGYDAQSLQNRLAPPSAAHWFGTDDLGRDVFARLVFGARVTLMIACLVAVIAAPLGLMIGAISGYFGGWADTALMRINDVFLSFPGLILALGFVAALGPGIRNAVIAIALTAWPPIARLARAETLTLRNADYVAAVRIQGASALRIILRHIVPMCLPSVIVRITLNMAGIIITAAGLGFLGLGAQPPMPEWGSMLSSGRAHLSGAWWISAVPGLAILITSLAFNLLGDGLRDVLDPRSAA